MGWSKNYSTLSRHRKVYDLAKVLGCDRFKAIGLVVAVHNFAVDFEPDGDLADYSDESLATQIGWKARRLGIKSAMTRVGLVDDSGVIHDWAEMMGSYREAERKREQRKRKREGKPSQDSHGTVVGMSPREERRGEERRGEERKKSRADEIRTVFAEYKALHPRSFPKVHCNLKEWNLIARRFEDGYKVADLLEAIAGMHRCPHNLGENDRSRKYLSLELCMRDAKHIQQYREEPMTPAVPMSAKTAARRRTIMNAIRARRQEREEGRNSGEIPGRGRAHLGTGTD